MPYLTDVDRTLHGLTACATRCRDLDARVRAGMKILATDRSAVVALAGWAWQDLGSRETPTAMVIGDPGHATILRHYLRVALPEVQILAPSEADTLLHGARRVWGIAPVPLPPCGPSPARRALRALAPLTTADAYPPAYLRDSFRVARLVVACYGLSVPPALDWREWWSDVYAALESGTALQPHRKYTALYRALQSARDAVGRDGGLTEVAPPLHRLLFGRV